MTSDVPDVDPALRKRRQWIEACAFVARGIGLMSTLAVAVGWFAQGPTAFPERIVAACWLAIAVMVVANTLAWFAFRRPAGRAYPALARWQTFLDTALVIAMVVLFAFEYRERTTWPLLSIAVVAAAIRNRLPGALIVWAVTSIAYAAAVLWLGARAAHPEDVPFAISMHLLIALVTGTQSSTFTRQLTELQRARRTLQQQVLEDGLTGLPNRLGLTAYAAELTARPLVVLLLDLDGFKPVNDTFGHGVGDEVLRIVGTRLTACLRAGDMAGRLGGDEFLVLLPETDEAGAQRVMAAVRTAVAEPMTVHGNAVRVGVSVGAAARPAADGADLDALTARADAAMYKAKARSRIISA